MIFDIEMIIAELLIVGYFYRTLVEQKNTVGVINLILLAFHNLLLSLCRLHLPPLITPFIGITATYYRKVLLVTYIDVSFSILTFVGFSVPDF